MPQPMLSDGSPRVSVNEAYEREPHEVEDSVRQVIVIGELPEIEVWYLEDSAGARFVVDSRTSLNGIKLSAHQVLNARVNDEGYALVVYPLDRS